MNTAFLQGLCHRVWDPIDVVSSSFDRPVKYCDSWVFHRTPRVGKYGFKPAVVRRYPHSIDGTTYGFVQYKAERELTATFAGAIAIVGSKIDERNKNIGNNPHLETFVCPYAFPVSFMTHVEELDNFQLTKAQTPSNGVRLLNIFGIAQRSAKPLPRGKIPVCGLKIGEARIRSRRQEAIGSVRVIKPRGHVRRVEPVGVEHAATHDAFRVNASFPEFSSLAPKKFFWCNDITGPSVNSFSCHPTSLLLLDEDNILRIVHKDIGGEIRSGTVT